MSGGELQAELKRRSEPSSETRNDPSNEPNEDVERAVWVVRGCGWKALGRFSLRRQGIWALDEWIRPPPPEGALELEALIHDRHSARKR